MNIEYISHCTDVDELELIRRYVEEKISRLKVQTLKEKSSLYGIHVVDVVDWNGRDGEQLRKLSTKSTPYAEYTDYILFNVHLEDNSVQSISERYDNFGIHDYLHDLIRCTDSVIRRTNNSTYTVAVYYMYTVLLILSKDTVEKWTAILERIRPRVENKVLRYSLLDKDTHRLYLYSEGILYRQQYCKWVQCTVQNDLLVIAVDYIES